MPLHKMSKTCWGRRFLEVLESFTEAGRLARLADVQDCAVILIAEQPVSPAAGSLVSLRAEVSRVRLSDGRFERRIRVVRDKRTAREWTVTEVVDGPDGLR